MKDSEIIDKVLDRFERSHTSYPLNFLFGVLVRYTRWLERARVNKEWELWVEKGAERYWRDMAKLSRDGDL